MVKKSIKIAVVVLFIATAVASCSLFGGDKTGLPIKGEVRGAAPTAKKLAFKRPFGMVYVPPGTFHMGPSDEDVNANLTNRNRQMSMSGFWMDATETTNNKYRQFTIWVRDSLAAKELGYVKLLSSEDSIISIDWEKVKTIKFNSATLEKIGDALTISPDSRLYATQNEIDPSKLVYRVETFDLDAAAKRENIGVPAKNFYSTHGVAIYPDTLVWIRDFTYSFNEPMAKQYFAHPAYGSYPVVGITWQQAVAYCSWRTHVQSDYCGKNGYPQEADYRLPSEAEWEYAARGGRTGTMYPWGDPYLRNKKGCALANFKVSRGNYAEDGGFYTVRVDSYYPNGYGLYNMSGNVSEWTKSYYDKAARNFVNEMNPDVSYNAKASEPPFMKRKVVRGGSWKDVGFYLQVSTVDYEYQDVSKSWIGFRGVIDLAPRYVR